jgi:hypothetical protein
MLSLPYGPRDFLSGHYRMNSNRVLNGQPVWERVDSGAFLYRNGGGVWLITNSEEAMMHRKGWRLDSLELKLTKGMAPSAQTKKPSRSDVNDSTRVPASSSAASSDDEKQWAQGVSTFRFTHV